MDNLGNMESSTLVFCVTGTAEASDVKEAKPVVKREAEDEVRRTQTMLTYSLMLFIQNHLNGAVR